MRQNPIRGWSALLTILLVFAAAMHMVHVGFLLSSRSPHSVVNLGSSAVGGFWISVNDFRMNLGHYLIAGCNWAPSGTGDHCRSAAGVINFVFGIGF